MAMDGSLNHPENLQRVLESHKSSLKSKYESLFEEIMKQGNKTLLNRNQTQLYIIEGESRVVKEHEILQIEEPYRTQYSHCRQINCNDIFTTSPPPTVEYTKWKKTKKLQLRTVLTKGISGAGKTVTVQKFVLDWAEGKANQNVDFMFVLPFRELNLFEGDQYSLHRLLCNFHPELKDMDPKMYDACKIVFIFDGLDESKIQLKFNERQNISDVTKMSSVGELLTNLVTGQLLPSAQIWITSRPASANQIPSQYVKLVTEMQGFNDTQKEDYFRGRNSDTDRANRIITHIRVTRSLHKMCCIPVFCWISDTVLQQFLRQNQSAELPKTLTEMYTHFLLAQIALIEKNEQKSERDAKNLQESNKEMILKLSELASKQLLKGSVVIYEEDLKECSIDVTEASEYSRKCPEIFKEQSLHHKKVYCFVHLSFQEFLAAFYVFFCYVNGKNEVMEFFKHIPFEDNALYELLWGVMVKSFRSENGHLDLFLRFLMGISLESNHRLLPDLLIKTVDTCKGIKTTAAQFKSQIKLNPPDDKCINLLLCLLEINDQTVYTEVEEYLKSATHQGKELCNGYCSLLKYLYLCSEEVPDELNLNKYIVNEEGCTRLIPAMRNCRKALLAGSKLGGKEPYDVLASVLQTADYPLRELDLSNNDLQDSREKLLSAALGSLQCKLEILRLNTCNLSGKFCEAVATVLHSQNSSLKELDLSNNDLQDSGVKLLSDGLKSPNCKLEKLGLSGCVVTKDGCSSLALALSLNSSNLRELDLSYNHPQDSGVQLLSARLEDPQCKLEKLNVDHGGKIRLKAGLRKYAVDLTFDEDTAHTNLSLSEGNRKVIHQSHEHPYPDQTERFDRLVQVLCKESLTGRCYWEVERSQRDCAVGVTYKGISRKGLGNDCWFGANEMSWCLRRSIKHHIVRHNKEGPDPHIVGTSLESDKVGVYLDWVGGKLSFYSISSETLTPIHIFHTTFTEPLYAGLGFGSALVRKGTSGKLCQIK